MSNSYTIHIINQTDEKQRFQVFADPPQVTGAVNTIWINSLAQAPPIRSGGEANFEFPLPPQYFAVCGTTLGEIVKITTEIVKPVVLGTSDSPGSDWRLTVENHPGAGPDFAAADESDSHVVGGFTINTLNESWIPSQHPAAYVGLGRQDPAHPGSGVDNVIPVATWKPKPNQIYQIRPNNVYWVVYGNIAPGPHDDIHELGVVPFKVGFTAQTSTTAYLTLRPDYTWFATFDLSEVHVAPPC
ncbi:hypothetical protein V8F20_008149 [Naviculisporaceae sp. PSN 640]